MIIEPFAEHDGPAFRFAGPCAKVLKKSEDEGPIVMMDGPNSVLQGPCDIPAGPEDNLAEPVAVQAEPIAKFAGPSFNPLEPLAI